MASAASANQALAHIACELVPTVPAHWRRAGQTIIEREQTASAAHQDRQKKYSSHLNLPPLRKSGGEPSRRTCQPPGQPARTLIVSQRAGGWTQRVCATWKWSALQFSQEMAGSDFRRTWASFDRQRGLECRHHRRAVTSGSSLLTPVFCLMCRNAPWSADCSPMKLQFVTIDSPVRLSPGTRSRR